MRTLLLIILTCCALASFCQNGERQELIARTIAAAMQHPSQPGQSANTPPPVITAPASILNQGGGLKQLIDRQQPGFRANTGSFPITRPASGSCPDTSYTRLLSVSHGMLYIQGVTPTADGGMLVPALMYDSTRMPNITWRTLGLLIKLDGDGNILWLKQFEDLTPGLFSIYNITRAYELSNHDIICAGLWNNDGNSSTYKSVIYRLNSSGNLIWQSCFQNMIATFNSPSGRYTFGLRGATDGLNGDVILCGTSTSNTSSGIIETVVRLNSTGQLVWDANYGNHGFDGSYLLGAEGITTFVLNGQIVLVGLSHGTTYPQTSPAVNIMKLDYASGNVVSKRFFKTQYDDDNEDFRKGFTYYWNYCTRLSNGHFVFYGKLFSDFINMTATRDHFGVIEFDAAFNLVDSYTISSELQTNYYNNQLLFDASGKGVLTLFEYISSYQANVFFGSFDRQQFASQRRVHYPNTGMPGDNGFAFVNGNGFAYVQTHFENEAKPESYIEFRKMHNSDTSSACLGKDTSFLRFLPLHVIEDPTYFYLDPNEPNKCISQTQNISQSDTTPTSSRNPCLQTSYCDTVKIHGNPVICGSSASITFTAFKNPECGGFVLWDIDRSAIDSLRVLNDSSVTVWFRNINWQGKLYARLPVGACNGYAIDSIPVSVLRAPVLLNLGRDTTLCNNNILVLHAGNSFSDYSWQDGSADSVFSVTQPGMYWVQVHDHCGNGFRDTVLVSPFSVSVSIGPDRVKCNSDTVHLAATPGFLNYAWSNDYNLSSTSAPAVVVNPLIDTSYYLKAEKTPGCFAFDTVYITVHHSPAIALGNDQSFCAGDSAVLDAGTGFQSYLWSNGGSGQQITVKNVGSYSVTAATSEGCSSSDTVLVLAVHPLPAVHLDKDPGLCAGSGRSLDAGSFSSYAWNTGAVTRTIQLTGAGLYAVTVTDANGCAASDTTIITTIYPAPQGFLPVDTAVCSYGSLQLKALSSYQSYSWNTGATAASITITQPGLYWLQVSDGNGCKGRDSIVVNPKECMKGFYIPTAFTPNGDGMNDLFRPMLFGSVKKYLFTIYNRWGQLVYQTSDLSKGWDGKQSGAVQPTNTFIWTCVYQFEGDEVKTEKGTFILVR